MKDKDKRFEEEGMGIGEIIWALCMVILIIGIPVLLTLYANCVMLDEICS